MAVTSMKIGSAVVEVVQGDITRQDTQAIVNAANEQLAPGGGVAGAIHKAAGPQLWEECRTLGGCKTGQAKITRGYQLPAEYVIHTVGPVYNNSPQNAIDLASCYRESLLLAKNHGIESIAFPAISTGIFGYPVAAAADIALQAVIAFLKEHGQPQRIRFVLFGEQDYLVFERALLNLGKKG